MELWDVLDAEGNATGKTHVRGEPLGDGAYNLIVDVWIRNAAGDYLISRRDPDKEPFAGVWEPTTGCAVAGDSSLQAALREVEEELGVRLEPDTGRFLCRAINHQWHYILDAWLFEREVDLAEIILQPGETVDARWAALAEIRRLVAEGSCFPADRLPELELLP